MSSFIKCAKHSPCAYTSPTTTSESFLMFLCSALNLKYELYRKYHQHSLFCPLPFCCVWPTGYWQEGRKKESELMFFNLYPALLKLEE